MSVDNTLLEKITIRHKSRSRKEQQIGNLMYWLFGGTLKTIPGFVAGAILGGLITFCVTHADRLFLAICMIF